MTRWSVFAFIALLVLPNIALAEFFHRILRNEKLEDNGRYFNITEEPIVGQIHDYVNGEPEDRMQIVVRWNNVSNKNKVKKKKDYGWDNLLFDIDILGGRFEIPPIKIPEIYAPNSNKQLHVQVEVHYDFAEGWFAYTSNPKWKRLRPFSTMAEDFRHLSAYAIDGIDAVPTRKSGAPDPLWWLTQKLSRLHWGEVESFLRVFILAGPEEDSLVLGFRGVSGWRGQDFQRDRHLFLPGLKILALGDPGAHPWVWASLEINMRHTEMEHWMDKRIGEPLFVDTWHGQLQEQLPSEWETIALDDQKEAYPEDPWDNLLAGTLRFSDESREEIPALLKWECDEGEVDGTIFLKGEYGALDLDGICDQHRAEMVFPFDCGDPDIPYPTAGLIINTPVAPTLSSPLGGCWDRGPLVIQLASKERENTEKKKTPPPDAGFTVPTIGSFEGRVVRYEP